MALLIRNGEIVDGGLARTRGYLRRKRDHHANRQKSRCSAKCGDHRCRREAGLSRFYRSARAHLSSIYGQFAKDSHETGSIAALIGGTTTYIEMCCPNRNDDALEGYELWNRKPLVKVLAIMRSTCRNQIRKGNRIAIAANRRRWNRIFQNIFGV